MPEWIQVVLITTGVPFTFYVIMTVMFRVCEGRWPNYITDFFAKKYRHEYRGVKVKIFKSTEIRNGYRMYQIKLRKGRNKWSQRVMPNSIEDKAEEVVDGFLRRIERKNRSKEEEEWKLRTLFDEEIPDKEEEGSG